MTDTKTSSLPLALEDYRRLRDEYDTADKVLSEVQAFVDEAGVPAINELRYAGYHLLNTIIPANGEGPPHEELTRAVNHCKRATYEASEMGLLTAFDRVTAFKVSYEQVVVSQVVNDWQEILTKCDVYRDEITSARQTEDDRTIDHGRFRDAFRELVGICRRLDHARDDLNRIIEKKQTDARRFLIQTILAVVALAVTILGIVAVL